jgi:hypothetical protein
MTKQDLIDALADYPDDTPIFIGRDSDLHAHQITECVYDDWAHSTTETVNGAVYETPARGVGVHIGPRF